MRIGFCALGRRVQYVRLLPMALLVAGGIGALRLSGSLLEAASSTASAAVSRCGSGLSSLILLFVATLSADFFDFLNPALACSDLYGEKPPASDSSAIVFRCFRMDATALGRASAVAPQALARCEFPQTIQENA